MTTEGAGALVPAGAPKPPGPRGGYLFENLFEAQRDRLEESEQRAASLERQLAHTHDDGHGAELAGLENQLRERGRTVQTLEQELPR